MKRALLILVLLVTFAPGVFAHEVRPAYLELRQTGPETYDVLWKVPGQGENLRLGLYVELPAACTNVTEPRGSMVNNAYHRALDREVPGRTDRRHDSHRRPQRDGDRRARASGTARRQHASDPAHAVRSVVRRGGLARRMEVARTYLVLGVEHILIGIDHLLFVLALFIMVRDGRLIATVTAFTLSHSLTLAVATLGYVHVPGPPVEAGIALSIVFVAAEIVHSR